LTVVASVLFVERVFVVERVRLVVEEGGWSAGPAAAAPSKVDALCGERQS